MFINCILQLYREHIIFSFLIIRRQSILIFMLEDEVSYHGDNLYKTDTVIAERDSSEIV